MVLEKFYGNFSHIDCGNGCNSHLQALLFEYGEPCDTDWDELTRIYQEHQTKCTPESPCPNDPNAYYSTNPDACCFPPGYCEYEPAS